MQSTKSTQEQVKRMIQGRKAALAGFFVLLLGGTALIGIGTPLQNVSMIINGGVVLVMSPLFLTIAIALRRKITRMSQQ